MRFVQSLLLCALGAIPTSSSVLPARQLTRWYGGGLTVLSVNDLTNKPLNDSAAILIHQPSENSALTHSCTLLRESLWNPDQLNFANGLNSSLSYQIYLGVFPKDQLFWVAKKSSDSSECRAIDYLGKVSEVDCLKQLPGLCTQSAPVSTMETNNDPTEFLVDQVVGAQTYTGFRDHFVFKFRGIRYAAPPKRFEYSTVYESKEEAAVPALKAGAECLQPIGEVREGMSEDCLFLNVWTPYLPPMKGVGKDMLKPVMFYIYGGGFTSGSGKNPNTDGTGISSRGDVVAVSLNYRVGNLGFLPFNDKVHNGNYGLADIVTALEWVNKNIQFFGGDPGRVTIYGESAGAVAVRALMASPKAKGLFANGISQSGPAGVVSNEGGLVSRYDSREGEYSRTTKTVLEQAGCANATDEFGCLRDYNATALVNLDKKASGIIVDGTYIVSNALILDGKGGYTKDVVYMTGTNRDELGIDFDPPGKDSGLNDIFPDFKRRWGWNLTSFARSAAFPIAENPTPEQILNFTVRISTDNLYTCVEQSTAYSAAKNGAFKGLYSFQFNRTYNPAGYTKPHCKAPATEARPNGDPDLEYFKCHAGEQMIVFGTILRDGLPDRDGLDVPFMQLVMDYWTSFARNRDPNPSREYLVARGYWNTLAQVEKVGKWEAATAQDSHLRLLQWNGRHIALPERQQCDALGLPLDYLEKS